jgi:hypothetical protein
MDSLLESVWLRRRRHLDTDCQAETRNGKLIKLEGFGRRSYRLTEVISLTRNLEGRTTN